MAKEHKYLTEAHRMNSEAIMKETAEARKTPRDLEEVLKSQKAREEQAKQYKEAEKNQEPQQMSRAERLKAQAFKNFMEKKQLR